MISRTDKVKEVARREAIAAAWNSSAKELRGEIEAEARAEYEANGNGVTWTMRDLGRVTLPLSTESTVIGDIDTLKGWVKARHPEEIETVEQIRPAFQTWLLQNTQIADSETVIDPATGEFIPGMAVREGGRPKALSITVDRPVKQLFAAYAEQEVARQLAAAYGESPAEAVPGAA